ncbi:conjugal transfer protein [Streptococcus suis]|nr:conjugal transfer protein [Streptococcus suis]NQQ99705.1 conjugal transfer protein [Streptococcus suis]
MFGFTSSQTALARLTGISPLHGSHPAVLIACDASNARTVTVREYHYIDRKVMAIILLLVIYGVPVSIARCHF